MDSAAGGNWPVYLVVSLRRLVLPFRALIPGSAMAASVQEGRIVAINGAKALPENLASTPNGTLYTTHSKIEARDGLSGIADFEKRRLSL